MLLAVALLTACSIGEQIFGAHPDPACRAVVRVDTVPVIWQRANGSGADTTSMTVSVQTKECGR